MYKIWNTLEKGSLVRATIACMKELEYSQATVSEKTISKIKITNNISFWHFMPSLCIVGNEVQ